MKRGFCYSKLKGKLQSQKKAPINSHQAISLMQGWTKNMKFRSQSVQSRGQHNFLGVIDNNYRKPSLSCELTFLGLVHTSVVLDAISDVI